MLKKKYFTSLLLLIFVFNLLIPTTVLANTNPYTPNIKKGVAFLKNIQNNDGGFPWYVGDKVSESDPTVTAWVVMAISAGGENPHSQTWQKKGQTPIDYLVKHTDELESMTDYARHLLALATVNSYEKEKRMLINKLKSNQALNGHFGQVELDEGDFINAHMWTILALTSVGEEIPQADKAKKWLINAQNKDGGFAWHIGLDSDIDDTAIAIQTLVALGEDPQKSITIKKALKYIKSLQQKDGGFSSGWALSSSNASTDSWVWQALISAGEKYADPHWSIKNKNVATHLLSLQDKSGYFRWMSTEENSSVIDTAYALIALAGKSMPVNIDFNKKTQPIKGLQTAFTAL